jgi:hypothetical protein
MWCDLPLDDRAKGLEQGCNGKLYRSGEFMPFYVPRPVMPQIDECDQAGFVQFATQQGVVIRHDTYSPDQLKPHQRISIDHAINMSLDVAAKPIIISSDMFILDGNHRWYWHEQHDSKLNCIVVELEFEQAIKLMFNYPKTYDLQQQGNVIRD